MGKRFGYIVMDVGEDYEQGLCLTVAPYLPTGGILKWREGGQAITIFPTFAAARAAITRTEHYRLAFDAQCPHKRFCKILPVVPASSSRR